MKKSLGVVHVTTEVSDALYNRQLRLKIAALHCEVRLNNDEEATGAFTIISTLHLL